MTLAVQLSHIHKAFGEHVALHDLSMRVEAGEVFGFLGPNGAGKTTSLRILLDIIRPDRGSVRVLGADSAMRVARRIGYLPEERGLYKSMTAAGVLAYLARLKGLDAGTARGRAYELLERYGLGESANRRIKQLSKGMAQKVQVLSTMAHDPDLLILDEPFSGLDPVNQQVLERLLSDMKAAGKTIIFSTHVMQHAERLCDRILLIAGGRDAFSGTIVEAKAMLDARIRLRTADDASPLQRLPAVTALFRRAETDGLVEWELRARRDFSVEQMLEMCRDNAIRIHHMTMLEPSLHDVFVRLLGAEEAKTMKEAAE